MTKSLLRRPVAVLALAATWALTGCDNKAGEAPAPVVSDPQTVADQALTTFETVGEVAQGVDQLAQGDFSTLIGDLGLPAGGTARGTEDITWDPVQEAWVLDAEGSESDESGTVVYDVYVWIQFRDAQNAPQENPDQTTAAIALVLDMTMSLESQSGADYFFLGLDYGMNMDVAGLPDGPYPVAASGNLGTTIVVSSPDFENVNTSLAMAWDMDLNVPGNGGCPTGSMSVSVEQYTVDAVYNGTDFYSWEMRESGVVIDSGVEPASCIATAPRRTLLERWVPSGR